MTVYPVAAGLEARLHPYLERVQELARGARSDAAMVRGVRAALEDLLAGPLEIPPSSRAFPAAGYGRNLLYRDPLSGFVVVAMVWPPGTGGEPHDHGAWGVVGVLEGLLELTHYERQDDGSDPDRAELLELDRGEVGPGAIAHVLPPHQDFHRLRNLSREVTAVSLHTYGRDLEASHVVDLATGAVREVRVSYHSVPEGPEP